MKLKKLLALILALMMAVCVFAACSDDAANTDKNDEEEAQEETKNNEEKEPAEEPEKEPAKEPAVIEVDDEDAIEDAIKTELGMPSRDDLVKMYEQSLEEDVEMSQEMKDFLVSYVDDIADTYMDCINVSVDDIKVSGDTATAYLYLETPNMNVDITSLVDEFAVENCSEEEIVAVLAAEDENAKFEAMSEESRKAYVEYMLDFISSLETEVIEGPVSLEKIDGEWKVVG